MGFAVAAKRGASWLLWIVLGWILLRGIVSIVAPPSAAPAPTVTQAVDEPEAKEAPAALAALFAREYLTWQVGKESERAQRLQGLLARHLDPQAGWSGGAAPRSQTAEATWPFATASAGTERWLVTVAARVTTETAAGPAPRLLYLAVPVAGGADGFVVYDYPTFVPAPALARDVAPALPGQPVTDEGQQVHALLTGFFKAYASGGPLEVNYFLEPGLKVRGLDGNMAFVQVDELALSRDGTDTWVAAVVQMHDPVSGTSARQRYTLQVAERDGRWYIKQIVQKGA